MNRVGRRAGRDGFIPIDVGGLFVGRLLAVSMCSANRSVVCRAQQPPKAQAAASLKQQYFF